MTRSPSGSPTDNMDTTKTSTPEALRERVTSFTEAELESFIMDVEYGSESPAVLEDAELRTVVEKRMEELGVTDTVRTKWETLRGSIQARTETAEDAAEESFVEELKEKGGVWAALGGAALAILSWFGFDKAKALRASLKEKGYLKTAIEGAREHPIFAAFISALGLKAGSEAYTYMTENAEPLTQAITEKAEEMGVPAEEAAKTIADKLRAVVGSGMDTGLYATVKGLSTLLGGEYDEETGVVTFPYATLRPPVIIAFAAGVRRNMSMPTRGIVSKLVLETRLSAMLRQTDQAMGAMVEAMPHKQRLAAEALEMLGKGITTGAPTAESMKLERILMTLQDDLNLQELDPKHIGAAEKKKIDIIEQMNADPAAAKKRVEILSQELAQFDAKQKPTFEKVRKSVMEKMAAAESTLKRGDYHDEATVKSEAIKYTQDKVGELQKNAAESKVAIGAQLTETMDGMVKSRQGLDVRGRQQLDRIVGGSVDGFLKKTTGLAEKSACRIARNPAGKFIVGGIGVVSMLPIALEGLSGLRAGKEGEAALKAAKLDAAEAGLSFVPGVGEALDFKSAFSGKDLNGRDLSTKQRVVSGVFGTLGTASIALGVFTGGLSIAGFRLLRGAVGTVKAVKVASRMGKTADAVDTSIDVVRGAQNQAELAAKMAKTSDGLGTMIKAKKGVDTLQNVVQLATYAELGCQLVQGVQWVSTNTEEAYDAASGKIIEGIDAAESFVTDNTEA